VTVRSVIQRINRRLKPDLEMLKITRGWRLRQEVGDYYVIDFRRNWITHKHVDPEQMGRDLGVLHAWEQVVEEETT
jgi:hypothetical protein